MGLGDEYSGRAAGAKEKKGNLRPYLPALGLILAICMGAISAVLAEPVTTFLAKKMPAINTAGPNIRWVIGGVIFLVLIGISSLILAAAAPKEKTNELATEKRLKQEKVDKEKERLEAKKRKREVQRKMAEESKRKAAEAAKKQQ